MVLLVSQEPERLGRVHVQQDLKEFIAKLARRVQIILAKIIKNVFFLMVTQYVSVELVTTHLIAHKKQDTFFSFKYFFLFLNSFF